MFDHITLTAKDYPASKAFYDKVFATLGLKELAGEEGVYSGFGISRPFFWIGAPNESHPISTSVHIAFAGKNKEEVGAFYKTAISAGAKDNGAPGYREEYHSGYYAAFVFDLDGNNIEVVYREENEG